MEARPLRAVLVANPRAGRARRAAALAALERDLGERGFELRRVTAEEGSGVAAALRRELAGESPGQVRVIVAGGDGTVNAALPALIGTEIPLALLPTGSVNVLARELGVPLSLREAIAVAAGGTPRRIDLGIAGGRPFALMAGVGFDAAVVHTVAPDVKNLVGSFAYVARGLRALLGYRPSRFHIVTETDTIEAQAWLAVVANASRYTYGWRLSPDARIDDGWLDLCLFESDSAVRTAGQVIAALAGRHAGRPGVRHLRARRLRFECEPPVCCQVDGDPAGETPVEIGLAPQALTVLAPPAAR